MGVVLMAAAGGGAHGRVMGDVEPGVVGTLRGVRSGQRQSAVDMIYIVPYVVVAGFWLAFPGGLRGPVLMCASKSTSEPRAPLPRIARSVVRSFSR